MAEDEQRYRVAKAAVYMTDDDAPFLVLETPSEAAAIVGDAADGDLVELRLGNASSWNGKPVFVRAGEVRAISPPKDQDGDGWSS